MNTIFTLIYTLTVLSCILHLFHGVRIAKLSADVDAVLAALQSVIPPSQPLAVGHS
jgi:Na+-translocating ferredoxin:NAD+ oxidoreductase RNF subunit RnfB